MNFTYLTILTPDLLTSLQRHRKYRQFNFFKSKNLLDYYKIDLANSSYDYEITNEHIVTMIDKEKYSFKYAKYRARRFLIYPFLI